MEGVFAINKPTGISSAQVLRDLQSHFNPSRAFAPYLQQERESRGRESYNQKNRRSRAKQGTQVKLGHGGTLDPLATGVLITAVGKGTKSLQDFLTCTKTYEAVVLFGVASDSYDSVGKVVARKSFDHITEAVVKDALQQFRGKIMQRPPIFSALRMEGKRLYEYAREGKELPREIEKRPCDVTELELVEWMPPGSHSFRGPEEEADQEEKNIVEKVLHLGAVQETAKSTLAPNPEIQTDPDNEPQPPAAKIRMTVTSGFYVRSLCHDLGEAVGSLALMAQLARTRQADFELGKNVFEYDDLAKGEDVWAPKIRSMLDDWNNVDSKSEDDISVATRNTSSRSASPRREARSTRQRTPPSKT